MWLNLFSSSLFLGLMFLCISMFRCIGIHGYQVELGSLRQFLSVYKGVFGLSSPMLDPASLQVFRHHDLYPMFLLSGWVTGIAQKSCYRLILQTPQQWHCVPRTTMGSCKDPTVGSHLSPCLSPLRPNGAWTSLSISTPIYWTRKTPL